MKGECRLHSGEFKVAARRRRLTIATELLSNGASEQQAIDRATQGMTLRASPNDACAESL